MIVRIFVYAALVALPAMAQIRVPTRAEIAAVMRHEKSLGYDVFATSNGARFSSAVILHFAREQAAVVPVRPFLLAHAEYFDAFLEATGVPANKVPEYVRIAHAFHEDQYVDPRMEKVIESVVTGAKPRLAVNVVAGWAAGKGVPEEYTYRDDSATPPLRVVHKRISRYRLLDFGEAILFDDIGGVFGRPTGGALGAMFSVIGDGRALRSYAAFAADNWQVTRTTAKKLGVIVTETAAVSPSGKGQKGLPSNRPDLVKIEQRITQPFEAKYVALADVEPSSWAGAVSGR